MFRKTARSPVPMPEDVLAWQVELRRHTMQERAGKPHVGVAPVLTVRAPGIGSGHSSHSIICGLLPAEAILLRKTEEFRRLYEEHTARGARAVYDAGLTHLEKYYERPEDFDATSITTLLGVTSTTPLNPASSSPIRIASARRPDATICARAARTAPGTRPRYCSSNAVRGA